MAEIGWTKEWPIVEDVFYWMRYSDGRYRDLPVHVQGIHVMSLFDHSYLQRGDIEGKVEFLGPISPSDFEQLTQLRVDSQVVGNYDNKRYEKLVEEMSVNSKEVKAIAARAFHTPQFNADTYMFDVRQLLQFHQVCCAELHDAIVLVRTLDRQLHFEKMASQGAINYTIELERKLENVATSMRSACIDAVRSLRHKSEPDDSRWNAALYHAETKLASVTIPEQKP